jgi:hypothetical protein
LEVRIIVQNNNHGYIERQLPHDSRLKVSPVTSHSLPFASPDLSKCFRDFFIFGRDLFWRFVCICESANRFLLTLLSKRKEKAMKAKRLASLRFLPVILLVIMLLSLSSAFASEADKAVVERFFEVVHNQKNYDAMTPII